MALIMLACPVAFGMIFAQDTACTCFFGIFETYIVEHPVFKKPYCMVLVLLQ